MTCSEHSNHEHRHGPGCGHREVRHGDHADYLHDGHLHAPHKGHADEHRLEVSRSRPGACAPVECGERHAAGCGHELVPHGDHMDFAVGEALHHPHGDHCDLHGRLDPPRPAPLTPAVDETEARGVRLQRRRERVRAEREREG